MFFRASPLTEDANHTAKPKKITIGTRIPGQYDIYMDLFLPLNVLFLQLISKTVG
jgi:hypothetical protein